MSNAGGDGPDFGADFDDASDEGPTEEVAAPESTPSTNGNGHGHAHPNGNGHASGHTNGTRAAHNDPTHGGFFDPTPKARANADRLPPFNLDAEAALLSLVLVDGDNMLPRVRSSGLLPGHFYSGAHRAIYDAALVVQSCDVITVAERLRADGRLAQVGGLPYLTSIMHAAPAAVGLEHLDSYVQIVRTLSYERDLLLASQLAVGQIYSRGGKTVPEIAADLRTQLDTYDRAQIRTGIRFLSAAEVCEPEPDANLLVAALGIAPGPPVGIFGQAYSGKSICSMAVGLAVALGKNVWGQWTCRKGPWVHLDHEQGRRRTKILVQRLAKGFGFYKEDLVALVADGQVRLAIEPEIKLTSPGALDAYVRAMDGAAVVTCDALKGMTPNIDENSSEIRDYLGTLRLASERTQCTVLLIHHAGKTPQTGERPRKEAGRGSSAIYDECASVFVLTGTKGEPTFVTHEKDRELGMTVDDFGLRIENVPTDDGDPRGGLRVTHLCKEQLQQGGAAVAAQGVVAAARELDAVARMVEAAIRASPGIAGVDAVMAVVKKQRKLVKGAVDQLLAAGRIVEERTTSPNGGHVRRLFPGPKAPSAPPSD